MTRLSINELRSTARGRWIDILISLGLPEESLTRQNKPCPACGGTDRFSFTDNSGSGSFVCRSHDRLGGDGFELVMHFLGCDLPGALVKVSAALSINSPSVPVNLPRQPAPKLPANDKRDSATLRRLWHEAGVVTVGDPVYRYLERRGIRLQSAPPVLRFHPALPYWLTGGKHPVRLGVFPAMLAAVQGEDGLSVAIHRTYLQPDGQKADIRDPKTGVSLPAKKLKTRGDGVMPGASIRLFTPVDGRLAVTEGIETALAVHLITGIPVWACVSASGLASAWLPPEVLQVVVAADNDRNGAGQKAANALAERLSGEGRKVDVLFPSTPGLDWLDVLNSERIEA